ncbi:MAG: BRCT domain-containing protein [Planctomycetota bacterium]|jgi:hypothetical protein
MAARQASQSNAMLYSMITFVALFVIAAVFAVQLRGVQEIVNNLYAFILGQQAAEKVSAAMQFNEISVEITKLNKDVLGQDVNPAIGPNGVALLKTIEGLKLKLDNSRTEIDDLEGINEDLQIDLDNATAQVEQNRQDFLAELEQFQSSYDKTRESFDNLKADMDNATAEQIETFQAKLDAEQSKLRQKQLDLQATEKKLDDSDTLLQDALTKLEAIKPKPDQEAQAYKPDAQIVRIDSQNGIIYLDAGIKDHVYRGLTFAIYDRNKPIPENGEGKAEIEVFQVSEQVSAARIVKSDTKDPIAKEDIVANLIWDRNTPNQFVVAGDFDFNNDGLIDADGAQRIAELIERYGGTVADTITVDTDFLIVGVEPVSLRRPTQQELDIDPMAQQRYEMSAKKIEAYNQILGKAGSLGIPVFNQKRFLYLIGYDTLMRKNPML